MSSFLGLYQGHSEKEFAWELGCISHPFSGEIPVFEKYVLSPTSKQCTGRISRGLWLWSPISNLYRVFASDHACGKFSEDAEQKQNHAAHGGKH